MALIDFSSKVASTKKPADLLMKGTNPARPDKEKVLGPPALGARQIFSAPSPREKAGMAGTFLRQRRHTLVRQKSIGHPPALNDPSIISAICMDR
jgi:hypothetical protein